MTGYTISQVAARTGFTASALRFYERAGLLHPDRSDAGYRLFDDRAVDRLRFIARGKRLGLSLDEITELVDLWDGDRCAPVAHRLRALVGEKLRETDDRIAELAAFAAELRAVRAGLTADPDDGQCGDGCACQAPAAEPPIACNLDADRMATRVADWRDLVSQRLDETIDVRRGNGGRASVTLRFPLDPVLAGRIAALAAAEQQCCAFFAFAITIGADGTELAVTAPAEAADMLGALLGVPS